MERINLKDLPKTKEERKKVYETLSSDNVYVVYDKDAWKELTHHKVIYAEPIINNKGTFLYGIKPMAEVYNPMFKEKRELTDIIVKQIIDGTYENQSNYIINNAEYPDDTRSIDLALQKLKSYPTLTCDIECNGLKFYNAGLISIAFAYSKHDGVAFRIDNKKPIMALLRDFFDTYSGKLVFHNMAFDATNLIYNLYMDGLEDRKGQYEGLSNLFRTGCFDDTMLMAYLCTNSCAGNHLGLKELAMEYSGDYGIKVGDDTEHIDDKVLLEYNLKDVLSTYYLYEKYSNKLIEEKQVDTYKNIFLPSLKVITYTQLGGLFIDKPSLVKAKRELEDRIGQCIDDISNDPRVKQVEDILSQSLADKWNSEGHKLNKTKKDYPIKFNPGSNKHLTCLLYGVMNKPVTKLTKKKSPSTSSDVIEEMNIKNPDKLLENIVNWSKAQKILTAFIPAFESAPDSLGGKRLYGNFHLGGTVSGRLSSSDINLQQLPSTGSPYAHLIKSIFRAPKGWVFMGCDYRSLEDRISAITTNDPNKVKVYTEGYDGHCLRSYHYFKDQMTDITKQLQEHPENEVKIINSIKKVHPDLRQNSKAATFALTYQGTYLTLMDHFGFSEEKAKQIEKAYHDLYKVSDDWVKSHLKDAENKGYVTCAFGLKVRTPLLNACVMRNRNTPKEASAEARTAGNALGQSFGLLNCRAVNATMDKVWNSKYRYDIIPVAQIHDASYYMVRDNYDCIAFLNQVLTTEMKWNDDPMIQNKEVELGGDMEIFYPTWADENSITNDADTGIKVRKEILNAKNNN